MYSPRHALAALEEGHGHGLNSHTSYFIMLFAFFKLIFIVEVSPRIATVWSYANTIKFHVQVAPHGQSPFMSCFPSHDAVKIKMAKGNEAGRTGMTCLWPHCSHE